MVERFLPQLNDDDERNVAEYMATLAAATIAAAPMPASADVLWLKAQLLKRWEAERKAQRPLDAMEPVQIGLGLVAAVVLMAWSVPALVRSFSFL